jgi:hypothetical protein
MEHAATDGGVDQHERQNKQALSPKHERQAGMWRRGRVDGDGKGNHVRPERDREGAEGRGEGSRDQAEGCEVASTANAQDQTDTGGYSEQGEDEKIRPFDPPSQDLKVFAQRKDEYRGEIC